MYHFAVIVGDPASIGPEIAAKALDTYLDNNRRSFVHLFADQGWFSMAERSSLKKFSRQIQWQPPDKKPFSYKQRGKPNKTSSRLAIQSLKMAANYCLNNPSTPLVTGPVDKNRISKVENTFRGQTEYLGKISGSPSQTMILSGHSLSVALVTTHLAVKNISAAISKEKICTTATHLHEHLLIRHGVGDMAILGLNPHASDSGLFGNEEKQIIEPAIKYLKSKKYPVVGPFSPDTFFALNKKYRGVVCMYHDQGLIPFKQRHFYDGINITMGLPFLRVSVDHGTAFDLAGTGIASEQSFLESLKYAKSWVRTKIFRNRRGQ